MDGCNLIMPENDRGVGMISVWHAITMQSIPPYPQCQPFNLCLLLDNRLHFANLMCDNVFKHEPTCNTSLIVLCIALKFPQ